MSRASVLTSIASTVVDYREGQISPIDEHHIDQWVSQFDNGVQLPILVELDHVLTRSYMPRARFEAFVADVITSTDIVGDDPCEFWSRANFFSKQLRGNSQKDMLALFEPTLQEQCGLSIADCGTDSGLWVYLDDAIYGGMHLLNDINAEIEAFPKKTTLHVIVIGLHTQGAGYAEGEIRKVFRRAGKEIEIKYDGFLLLESREYARNDSDVLWPTSIPDHAATEQYVQAMKHKPVLRSGSGLGKNEFFSSATGRVLLEQEFLKAGAQIRSENEYLTKYMRPLGNSVLETLGLGALIVMFRNCANNCPLVFWAGGHPLFERDNN